MHTITSSIALLNINNENHDTAIMMSFPMLTLYCPGWVYINDHIRSHCTVQNYSNISINTTDLAGNIDIFKSTPLPWLKVFKYFNQSYCTSWRHLNVIIRNDEMI